MKPVCVITGATGGIGWSLCEGFGLRGYDVVALDVEMIRELPAEVRFIQADLRDEEAVRLAFSEIKKCYGAIHVLINNAALSTFCKPMTELTVGEFDDVIATNLRSVFLCSQEFIAANRGEVYGRIINMSSTRWNQNEAHWEAYGASKGGIVSLTNTMAISLSDTPITVNAISPGWIQTFDYDKLTDADHLMHPSGRVGMPRDILNAALFLADVENDFVNAANLVVDGGMTKKMIY